MVYLYYQAVNKFALVNGEGFLPNQSFVIGSKDLDKAGVNAFYERVKDFIIPNERAAQNRPYFSQPNDELWREILAEFNDGNCVFSQLIFTPRYHSLDDAFNLRFYYEEPKIRSFSITGLNDTELYEVKLYRFGVTLDLKGKDSYMVLNPKKIQVFETVEDSDGYTFNGFVLDERIIVFHQHNDRMMLTDFDSVSSVKDKFVYDRIKNFLVEA